MVFGIASNTDIVSSRESRPTENINVDFLDIANFGSCSRN